VGFPYDAQVFSCHSERSEESLRIRPDFYRAPNSSAPGLPAVNILLIPEQREVSGFSL
jgi:hypothetical protein